jgi:hypothetical protein
MLYLPFILAGALPCCNTQAAADARARACKTCLPRARPCGSYATILPDQNHGMHTM